MTVGDAANRSEMSDTRSEGSGRNSREFGQGVSNVTVKIENLPPGEMDLMEAVVERKNMIKCGLVALLDHILRFKYAS